MGKDTIVNRIPSLWNIVKTFYTASMQKVSFDIELKLRNV
jgi:hypothetical protein